MSTPDIAVMYDENLSSEMFDDFRNGVSNEGLNLVVESKPESEPFMCAEWFIPTAIVAYIGKSYFDGFLKEMGKDHFSSLKKMLSGLAVKSMSKPRIEPVLIGTEGKLSKNNPYSLAFSVYAEANDGNRFKLLVPKPSDTEDYTEIIYKFLEFLESYHSGIKRVEDIGCDLSKKPPSGHIFVHLNPKTKNIEWLDESLYR